VIRRTNPLISLLLPGLIGIFATPRALSAAKSSEQEKAGAVLFRDKGCTYCHGVGGVGTKKAPALTGLPKDKSWTPEKITNQILNGGQKMPPFRESVTDEDVSDLIAYLRSKNKPVPPPATAQETFPASSPQ
jgi:mono/diheme cytochrome c family protein